MKSRLEIQHEPADDRWKVILRVNDVALAIGAECATLKEAQNLRTAFRAALFELGIRTPNAPHQARAVASRPECGCSALSEDKQ